MMYSFTGDPDEILKKLCLLNDAVFAAECLFLFYYLGKVLHPVFLFGVFVFLFSNGQFMLHSVGIVPDGYNVITRIATESLIHALHFSIPAYIVFSFGSILGSPRKVEVPKIAARPDKPIVFYGIIFLCIGIIPFSYVTIFNLRIILSSGYSSYYSVARVSNLFAVFSYYFFVGIFLLIAGGGRKTKKVALLCLLVCCAIRFICGDRGDGISLMLAIYMLYLHFLSKNKQHILLTVLVAVVGMTLVPVIANYRHATGQGFVEIVQQSIAENNVLVATLANLGGTVFPLAKVMELIPSTQGFLGGASYLASFVYLVPSFLRIGGLETIAGTVAYMSPANWLMQTLGMTYGPGFTPFAEAYMNFGMYGGMATMGGFGFLAAKVLSLRYFKKYPEVNYAFQLLAFYLFAMSARGSINSMLAFFVRYLLLPYLCIRYIKTPYSRKEHPREKVAVCDQ